MLFESLLAALTTGLALQLTLKIDSFGSAAEIALPVIVVGTLVGLALSYGMRKSFEFAADAYGARAIGSGNALCALRELKQMIAWEHKATRRNLDERIDKLQGSSAVSSQGR
jgi:Zn-dependent protease with chaperone function